MKKSMIVLALSLVAATPAVAQDAAPAAPAAVATKGKMLTDARGARLATITRVTADGSAQIIIDGKVVTVPAGTIALIDGKLTTSLSKNEVIALR